MKTQIVLYLSISIALLTASAFQKRSRPQQLTTCRSLHATGNSTAHEGLAQGPYTRRLKRDSNPQLSGRKASTLSMRHHAPLYCIRMPTMETLGVYLDCIA